MFQMRGITKHYSGVMALNGVNLDLAPGTVHALVGKNGAGKSTLMKVLSGVTQPDSGEILIDGKPVVFRAPADAHAAGIAIVHQELSLVPSMSAAENIFLGSWPKRRGLVDWQRLSSQASEVLARLKSKIAPSSIVSELSIADQQMVEIAKALAKAPRVLVLDEPTSALGDADSARLLQVIRDLAEAGVSVVYISHRLAEVEAVCSHVTVLRNGETVGETAIGHHKRSDIVNMMVGQTVTVPQPGRTARPDVILSVRGLTRRGVLTDIDFDLHAGEVLGIAGLVGAGRTELVRALFGVDRIDSGTIDIDGTRVLHPTIAMMKRLGMAFLPEDRKHQALVLDLTVRENTTLAVLAQLGSRLGLFRHAKERAIVDDVVERFQVALAHAEVPVRALSGGNQQKIVFGKWLATAPKILLLDEPTRGIDVQAKAQIVGILQALAAEGLAIIFISSEIEEVLQVSDRILTMARGRITSVHDADTADLNDVVLAATS